MKSAWIALALLGSSAAACAQVGKTLGSVAAADATVWGADADGGVVKPVAAGRLSVSTGSTVTAKAGRNAEIALSRGGSILVCQTTDLHITAGTNDALMMALGRGAMEIRTTAGTSEVVVTPDMRLIPTETGALDLRMRVTYNGDTCVENRGRKAPPLSISDAFGELNYLLKPGQHVMFEHGSLRAVDDHETTPCGCPPDAKQPESVSLADALVRGGQMHNGPLTPQQAEAAHPFPTAVSDGLAAPPIPAPQAPGERHVQVASTLRFDPEKAATAGVTDTVPVPAIIPQVLPPAPRRTGPFGAIGRFFKHLFVR